jgi:predicted transcriptional regulator of viral defense system
MEKRRSRYTKHSLSGLGKASRAQLATVLRKSAGVVTPALAAEALSLSRVEAAKLLSRWSGQGWMQRVRQGMYIPVALESDRADSSPEDAWTIAEVAFAPCFISGWSAAEHWGLTEQVFRTVLVSTSRRLRDRKPKVGGFAFRLRTVGETQFFGLKTVWRGRMRVNVSDPSRTIVDLLSDPALGGGLQSSVDMFQNYLDSKEFRNIGQLVSYAEAMGVGAVFKRLGYLLERFAPKEREAIARCARLRTQGNAKLDPSQSAKRLVTAWRLWLPAGWDAR